MREGCEAVRGGCEEGGCEEVDSSNVVSVIVQKK